MCGLIRENMRVTGIKIKCMDLVSQLGQMEEYMKDSNYIKIYLDMLMIKNMDMVLLLGVMVENT